MELEELTNFLKKFSKNKNKNSKKRILCDVLGSGIPIYIYNICIFTITMNRFGYGIDYQITSNHSKLKRMYSFNAIKFHEPTKYSIFKFLPKILLLNMRSLPNFFDMDKLFNMYIGDIYIGDLIYDSYTRYEKKSTVDNINFRYFKKINEAFFLLLLLYRYF